MFKVLDMRHDDFFTKERFRKHINFYDFEVFEKDWLLVVINPFEDKKYIIANDREALISFYKQKNEEVWCGYNSRRYDTFILKTVLLGKNPKKVSDFLINGGNAYGLEYDWNKYQLYNFDIGTVTHSLKQLEGFMGHNIEESNVSFLLKRDLSEKEMFETIHYCTHDVKETMEVFKNRAEVYDSQIALLKTFKLPFKFISKTQAQLVSEILQCERVEGRELDEWNYKKVDTLQISRYKDVVDWFFNPENHSYAKTYERNVCGIPHIFGWGGLHGCINKPVVIKGKIYHGDITSTNGAIINSLSC